MQKGASWSRTLAYVRQTDKFDSQLKIKKAASLSKQPIQIKYGISRKRREVTVSKPALAGGHLMWIPSSHHL